MDDIRGRLAAAWRRFRRLERAELAAARRWLEHTENLLHVSALVLVPLTIAAVTALANAVPSLSFLLFPPLASGAYTLFADPEGRHATPTRFVVGLTLGAICGWIAIATLGAGSGGAIDARAAGLAVFLTGAGTWLCSVEEPAAYAVALLLLVQDAPPGIYVASVAVASGIVALVYVGWHDVIYERRAEFLYASTGSDDDVLVPMVEGSDGLPELAARIAAGHEGGKVVLLGVVEDDGSTADPDPARGESSGAGDPSTGTTAWAAPSPLGSPDHLVADLEDSAAELAEETGVTVDVVVARGTDAASVTVESARETGSDLVLAPFDGEAAQTFVTSLFVSELDVAATRASNADWRRILVPIRSAGDLAHLKVDLARRIAGPEGRVTVAHCIASERRRRHAEELCDHVVDAYDGRFETLVARGPIEDFLADHAAGSDLIVMGASTDRSRMSRVLSKPTYRRVQDLPTDLFVVHGGRR